jgi:hypothetical protein
MGTVQVGNFLEVTNVMLMLAWLAMGALLVAIPSSAGEVSELSCLSADRL